MPLDRSLEEVFQVHADALKNDIRKVLPATVTAVHADTQTVDVQIAVNNVLFDDLGNTFREDAPSITNVPLGVVRGGGFFVWVPVQPGDSVLLVFSDLSCDTWRAGDGSPKDPGWVGKHTHDSPFAIPMVAPDAKKLASPAGDANAVIIGKDGADEQIHVTASDIKLGAGATLAVALAQKIDLFIRTVMAWTPVPNDGGAALHTLLAGAGFSTSTTTAATLVKAK